MADHIYLVDGSGFIFRAFYALPPLKRPDGTPVGAVLGFVNMMLKLVDDFKASHLAVIFDAGRKTFRNDLYPDYKANRSETPEDLIPQFSLIRQACQAFQIQSIEQEGFEADDLIATYARLAREQGLKVTIVSSDKDLMQLVAPGVDMFDPVKNKTIGPDQVVEKFGVGPQLVRDMQALIGDSSDNIPGVPGVGPKTALELVQAFGSLEGVLARAEEIPQARRRQLILDHGDLARISYQLVSLDAQVPTTFEVKDLRVKHAGVEPLITFLEEQNFSSIIKRLKRTEHIEEPTLFSHLKEPMARITSVEKLKAWLETNAKPSGVLAVEFCMTGHGHQLQLVRVALASGKVETLVEIADVRGMLALIADPALLKIGHNLKTLMRLMVIHGVTMGPVDDVMVLSYVLANGLHGHDLATLARTYLHTSHTAFEGEVDLSKITPDELDSRLLARVGVIEALYATLKNDVALQRMTTVYETLERPLLKILSEIEATGILVDPGTLKMLSLIFEKELARLEGEIHQLAGRSFNIASPKQLGEILFDELKFPLGKKGTKTGAYVTNADVLEELAGMGHILPEKVLEWRGLSKLKSTYTDALLLEISPDTGRIHTEFAMTKTTTGRLSSLEPNLQNIPVRTNAGMRIREAFVAPPGMMLVSFDYSQIELRLLAHVAQIKPLQEAFAQDLDIHALTASQVFGIPLEAITPELRQRAKAINFGIIYGISAFGLARQIKESRGQAQAYMNAYFLQYPGIKAYMDETLLAAKTHGYVTTPWGRRSYIPGLTDANMGRRQMAQRQAINAPLQGGAADIIKRAMVRVAGARLPEGARLLLQVHDELLFEVPEERVQDLITLIAPLMEGCVTLSVPLKVDTSFGKRWSDL
jgi:DNA polymerase-1